MQTTVIFDNTIFSNAARIHSCDLILLAKSLFHTILVPNEVLNEIQQFPIGKEITTEKRMQTYADMILLPPNKGLQLCTSYDSLVLNFLKTQENEAVNKGETEAIAQAVNREIKFLFTDDEKCVQSIKESYNNIRFVSTLYLIALLDVSKLLTNYELTLQEFFLHNPLPQKSKDRKDKMQKFRDEHIKALQHFSLPTDKKYISQKTSLKRMGIQ